MKNQPIILIVGESGSGKSFVCQELYKQYGLSTVESYTTRPMRSANETGHTFVTDEEFDKLTDMVAYTEYNGYRYCATAQQVEENQLYLVDPNGINYFLEHYNGNKQTVIVNIKTTRENRYNRMIARGQTHGEAIERINLDDIEFAGVSQIADYIVDNDSDNMDCVNEIYNIWRENS